MTDRFRGCFSLQTVRRSGLPEFYRSLLRLWDKDFDRCHGYLDTVVVVTEVWDIQAWTTQTACNSANLYLAYRQTTPHGVCVDIFGSRYRYCYIYLHVLLEVPNLQHVYQSAQTTARNGILHGLLRSLAYILTVEIRTEPKFDNKPSQLASPLSFNLSET